MILSRCNVQWREPIPVNYVRVCSRSKQKLSHSLVANLRSPVKGRAPIPSVISSVYVMTCLWMPQNKLQSCAVACCRTGV